MSRRKEKKVQDLEEEKFLNQLEGKKIPLLILDVHWHELFPEHRKTALMKQFEKAMNELLKEQARLSSDLKNAEFTKKQLMDQVIQNMGVAQRDKKEAKKQEGRQKFIVEMNDKIEKMEKRLEDIPLCIQETNQKLLIESMRYCYRRLKNNFEEVKELEKWIESAREALKERLLEKQDKEMKNMEIYSYMHHMLGCEVIEIFDQTINIEEGERIEE